MKLYTKRGDEGQTDLFGQTRANKDAPRIQAIGDVDELNSFVGLAAAACDHAATNQIQAILREVQSRLFELGSDLAAPAPKPPPAEHASACVPPRAQQAEPRSHIPRITAQHVAEIEQHIDDACRDVPAMKHFILPGGTEAAARLHVARTVCRRAERSCIALSRREPINEHLLIYLNRLSDLLFALGRQANHQAGVPDIAWIPH